MQLSDAVVTDETRFPIDGNEQVNLRGGVYLLTTTLAGGAVGEAGFCQTVGEVLRATRALCFS